MSDGTASPLPAHPRSLPIVAHVRPDAHLGASVMAGILLVVSLLGPTWLYVPASVAAKIPSAKLSFQDLNQLMSAVPSTGWQDVYFGWLGWTLVVLTCVVAVVNTLVRTTLTGAALATLSLLGLVATIFAVKGGMSWPYFFDATKYMRIGANLLIVGYFITLGIGLINAADLRNSWRNWRNSSLGLRR